VADLLEQGSAFLEDQRHRHMTRPVMYRRAADEVEVSATVGRTIFEQADDRGLVSRLESRDFLVRVEDLVLAGSPVLPKAGDQVREAQEGKTFIYEVMAPGGEPPFRYSDPYRRTLRIHTKHVGTEGP
jgi:predicted aconitase